MTTTPSQHKKDLSNSNEKTNNTATIHGNDDIEIRQILLEIGMTTSDTVQNSNGNNNKNTMIHPIFAIGFGTAVLINIGILCSLPPVLRGRGAPYLPTLEKNMKSMFQQLRNEPQFMKQHAMVMKRIAPQLSQKHVNKTMVHSCHKSNMYHHQNKNEIIFVDLGSGDGRVVFHAAQTQLFTKCIGYEINPFLVMSSWIYQQFSFLYDQLLSRRIIHHQHMSSDLQATTVLSSPSSMQPQIQFYLRDLWNVDLQNVHVVAIYGLAPIMKELGAKLQNELTPGTYVLSNIFTIPGWRPLQSSTNNTYIYRTPDCWTKVT